MQNTKNSKEVPGTGIAPEKLQEQLNETTKELFSWVEYCSIKNHFNVILSGWISGNSMEYLTPIERVNTLDFYYKLLTHFEDANFTTGFDGKEIIPSKTYDCFVFLNKKDVKKYFKQTLGAFLESDFANDKENRSNILYDLGLIEKYVMKVYEINKKIELQKT